MKTLLLSLLVLLFLVVDPDNCAATQNRDDCCVTTQAAMLESGQASQASKSTTTKTESEKKKKKSFPPRGAIVAAPLPIVSPAIGAGVVPILGYIFPFGKDDNISPPSTVGGAGFITNNGSSGFAVAAQLFMKEVKSRGHVALRSWQCELQPLRRWGRRRQWRPEGDALDQAGQLYFGEALRRIPWQFFIGPRFWTGDSVVAVRPSSGETAVPPSDLGLHTTLRALGFRLMRDTRPNHFYPTAGMFTQFTSDFFAQALGSKYTFQSYRFTFNKYWTVGKNQVLAYNLFDCSTGGNPPFYGNCVYGTNNELRGYEAGRYLDRYMIATQLEYRVSLPKRFGLAAFGGIGEVVPGGKEIFRINNFLPSIGGGPRFELSPKPPRRSLRRLRQRARYFGPGA